MAEKQGGLLLRERDMLRGILLIQIRKTGIKVGNDLNREVGNLIKELNEMYPSRDYTTEELMEIIESISRELIEMTFKKPEPQSTFVSWQRKDASCGND